MTARCLVVAAILGTGLAGRPARAQTRERYGIFVRFLAGPAGITGSGTLIAPSPSTEAYRGGGAGFVLSVGSALSRSVVFYGEATYVFAVGEATYSDHDPVSALSLRFESLGAGLSYYFPSNLYLGTSLFLGGYSNGPGGLGASAIVGKEWRVSDRWGLGLAGRLFVHSAGTWTGGGAMIALSASYN